LDAGQALAYQEVARLIAGGDTAFVIVPQQISFNQKILPPIPLVLR
jgi:hypothetical protein